MSGGAKRDDAAPARRPGRTTMVAAARVSAICALVALPACQTTVISSSSGRPMPPPPRAAPPTPDSAVPQRMMLVVAPICDDTDGNGFPDLIKVEAALFAPPYPTAMEARGAFVFSLYRKGSPRSAPPLAEWRFDDETVTAAQARTIYGVCYRLSLSLLDALGTDRLPPMPTDLRGRYEPSAGGTPVRSSDELRPVQIGGG